MPHKDIRITIHNLQTDESGEEQSLKMTTLGRLYKRPNETVLMYREPDDGGMKNTSTTVAIPHDLSEVTMTRIGDHRSKMEFKEGSNYLTHMSTPFGFIDLGFYTQKMTLAIGETEGQIEINYSMDFNHKSPISNHINIRYSEVESKPASDEKRADR